MNKDLFKKLLNNSYGIIALVLGIIELMNSNSTNGIMHIAAGNILITFANYQKMLYKIIIPSILFLAVWLFIILS